MLDGATDAMDERLVGLVERILDKNGKPANVGVNDELATIGLSSIDMVNLMLAVEAEFDLTIPQADLTIDNFRSVSSIAKLLARLLHQA